MNPTNQGCRPSQDPPISHRLLCGGISIKYGSGFSPSAIVRASLIDLPALVIVVPCNVNRNPYLTSSVSFVPRSFSSESDHFKLSSVRSSHSSAHRADLGWGCTPPLGKPFIRQGFKQRVAPKRFQHDFTYTRQLDIFSDLSVDEVPSHHLGEIVHWLRRYIAPNSELPPPSLPLGSKYLTVKPAQAQEAIDSSCEA